MLSWFQKTTNDNFLKVDIHSHLIPSIDDGVKTIEDSLLVIKQLASYGIEKIITTPHIITGHYPNDSTSILNGLNEVKKHLVTANINVKIEAAAEYYFDESFMEKVSSKESLLYFGTKYVLVETGFLNKPFGIEETFFQMITNGYTPVLAHPERYPYLYDDLPYLDRLKNMGVKLQVNALSFLGQYSKESKKFIELLIAHKMIDFIGSDAHRFQHAKLYEKAYQSKLFQKCKQLDLLNDALL